MSNTIRVISAAVSQTGAVFYTEDGNERTISITDPRISKMVDQVLEAVSKNQIPVEVDMTTYSVFAQIEEESGGLMKFFRVAKKKIASLLGSRQERSNTVSSDGFHSKVKTDDKGKEIVAEQPGTDPVTPEIVKALTAAHNEAENKALSVDDTTVVAVIGDTPIVGAEALEPHAKAAVASGETIGFRRLVERLGAVAKVRKHTVQEALVFLKGMDLPFANDGTILAYKSLRKTGEEGVFIDNHSGQLKQGLGTKVEMDVEAVDDNRRTLCSNGLHVARRGYLGGYGTGSGHVICLIKIAPEDVISVPMGEQSKMRVRAYHIVAVLSDADMEAISQQKSFTAENMDQASLLAKVIRGDHVGVLNVTTEHKKEPGQRTGKVDQMIPVANVNAPKVEGKEIEKAHTVDVAATEETATKIDVKSINEKLKDVEPAKPVEQPKAQAADGSQAFILFSLWKSHKTKAALDELMAYRKSIKFFKGWISLGLTEEQANEVKAEIKRLAKASNQKAKAPAPSKKVKEVKPSEVQKILKTGAKKAAATAKAAAAEDKKAKGQNANKTRQAFDAWQRNPTDQMAQVVLIAKKASKKGWDALGFTTAEIKLINEQIIKK